MNLREEEKKRRVSFNCPNKIRALPGDQSGRRVQIGGAQSWEGQRSTASSVRSEEETHRWLVEPMALRSV